MRARHRHFNPRSIGASMVLDARAIAQSDNTAVSTWPDRSGNGYDATQATAANQPKFKASQFGGQPSVQFDGNDVLLFPSGGMPKGNQPRTFVVVANQDNSSGIKAFFYQGNSTAARNRLGLRWNNDALQVEVDTGIVATGAVSNATSVKVVSYVYAGTTFHTGSSIFANGISQSFTTTFADGALNTQDASRSVGARIQTTDQYLTGNISIVIAVAQNLETSLLRRIEQHVAYSFKIACS